MNSILTARDLQFKDIINYPSIDIKRNQTTFICGKSGCGKSTLLKLLNATVSPSKGIIMYNGENIFEINTVELRKEVILASQIVFLFDGTVEDNFNQYYAYREMEGLTAENMKKYLAICCADFELSARCEKMSGGERQRIFMAICLSFMPKVLMLDEPTSALDQNTAKIFFENITSFCAQKEITLIVISHDKILTEKFADNKIMLESR